MVGRTRHDVEGALFPCPHVPEGLSGPHGRVQFLGLTLETRQERAFLEAAMRFHAQADACDPARARLLLRADAAVTHNALAAFHEACATEGRDRAWRSGGRFGAFSDELALGRSGPLLVWLAPGGEVSPARIAAAEPLVMDPKERLLEFALPSAQFGAGVLELPLSDLLVLPTHHWLQALWANLLALAPFLWRQLAGRNIVEVAWNAFKGAALSASLDPRKVGARLGRRGPGCHVHPSAVVEGCWLGEGVRIGANAVVRASVLGAGATVEDLALVEGVVAGAGATVQRRAMVKYCLLHERTMAGGAMQLGVLDRDAAAKYTSALMDQSFGQGVRVRVGDDLVAAPLGLAGVCLGEASVVGANVFVAPGRCIPAFTRVMPAPEVVLSAVAPELSSGGTADRPLLAVVRAGRLELP